MSFHDPTQRAPKELFPGVSTRTFWGEKMLMSLLDLAPNGYVPPHSHPHEQVGIVLEGELELTIAGESRLLKEGEIFVIPGGVEHSARSGAKPAKALDIFSPVRPEYQY